MANGSDSTSDIYAFEGYVAEQVTTVDSPNFIPFGTPPLEITPHAIEFEDQLVAHRRPPHRVIEYGACLASRAYVLDQFAAGVVEHQPFRYQPITRSRFMQRGIEVTYQKFGYAKHAYQPEANNAWYSGSENGVAHTTDELLTEQRYTHPEGIADLIIANKGVHTTTPELRAGIRRSAGLLRSNGALVLSGYVQPRKGEVGIEEAKSWAATAGFNTRGIRHVAELVDIATNAVFRGSYNDGRIESVVLFKD